MKNAIKLSGFYISCFKKIAKISVDIQNNTKEIYTLEWLKLHKTKEVSPSKLHKSNRSKIISIDEAKIILNSLASQGYGYMVNVSNGTKFILF